MIPRASVKHVLGLDIAGLMCWLLVAELSPWWRSRLQHGMCRCRSSPRVVLPWRSGGGRSPHGGCESGRRIARSPELLAGADPFQASGGSAPRTTGRCGVDRARDAQGRRMVCAGSERARCALREVGHRRVSETARLTLGRPLLLELAGVLPTARSVIAVHARSNNSTGDHPPVRARASPGLGGFGRRG